jgi:hypothetical protein
MNSLGAVNLLLGTAAQETNMGEFLLQRSIGIRGGIGLYQMQQSAYDQLWDNVISKNVALRAKLRLMLGYEGRPMASRMASDLFLATAMARLYYYVIKVPLPDSNDIEGMASFYKKWWNTPSGKATEEQFIENYKRYVSAKESAG